MGTRDEVDPAKRRISAERLYYHVVSIVYFLDISMKKVW